MNYFQHLEEKTSPVGAGEDKWADSARVNENPFLKLKGHKTFR